MDEDFVPYELAVELKEIDFDEPCLYYFYGPKHIQSPIIKDGEPIRVNHNTSIFSTCCSPPTYSQAFRWFRQKHKLHNGIYPYYDEYEYQIKDFRLPTNTPINGGLMLYEEAERACLEKLIELVK